MFKFKFVYLYRT